MASLLVVECVPSHAWDCVVLPTVHDGDQLLRGAGLPVDVSCAHEVPVRPTLRNGPFRPDVAAGNDHDRGGVVPCSHDHTPASPVFHRQLLRHSHASWESLGQVPDRQVTVLV